MSLGLLFFKKLLLRSREITELCVVDCHTLCYQLNPRSSSVTSWLHILSLALFLSLVQSGCSSPSSSSSHLVFGVMSYVAMMGGQTVLMRDWTTTTVELLIISVSWLFIVPPCDLRWLFAMETGLCGPQNTACLQIPLFIHKLDPLGLHVWVARSVYICVGVGRERICVCKLREFMMNLG